MRENVPPEEHVRRLREALTAGDRSAAEGEFTALMEASHPSTERWLRRIIVTTFAIRNASAYQVSEDLRQELALEVWRHLTRPEKAWECMYFQALLYAQKHVATRYMRQAGYWVDRQAVAQGLIGVAAQTIPYDGMADAEAPDLLYRADCSADVYALVMRLPPKERAAVVFRYWRGLKEREIAKELRCTARTVRTLLKQAQVRMGVWYKGAGRPIPGIE